MNTIKFLAAVLFGTLFTIAPAYALSVGVAANANVNAGSTTASASTQTKITTAKSRANQEIVRRVNILTQLNVGVQAMVKVSANEKTAIASEVQTEISNLNSLDAKIQAETDVTTLKTDVQSITQDYRIFMLVIPQGRIEVTADKIQTVVSEYTSFSAKLQTRIAAAPAGTDTTQVSAWLADMNAKVADANTQAEAAVSLVAALQPDQGNAAVQASNKTALQNARADLKTALSDLKTARQDAANIVKAIESWKISTSTSATTSVQ